ncbi:Phage tail sheath protein [Sphingomonas paucimobilis]|nr:Phage tail sheath protein [Sphingomonas paucimobilis]
MSFLHGINVREVTRQARGIATVSTAVIGLVATAPAADATAFPLDTVVKVTNLQDAMAKAGATGTLQAALRAIAGRRTRPSSSCASRLVPMPPPPPPRSSAPMSPA